MPTQALRSSSITGVGSAIPAGLPARSFARVEGVRLVQSMCARLSVRRLSQSPSKDSSVRSSFPSVVFVPDPELHDGGIALGGSMTGTVRWFKNEKGYGRITGDDGYVYFVHFSAIGVDGYKTLSEGERVRFEWHGG